MRKCSVINIHRFSSNGNNNNYYHLYTVMTLDVSKAAVAMEINKGYKRCARSVCDVKRNKSRGVLMLKKLKQKD